MSLLFSFQTVMRVLLRLA